MIAHEVTGDCRLGRRTIDDDCTSCGAPAGVGCAPPRRAHRLPLVDGRPVASEIARRMARDKINGRARPIVTHDSAAAGTIDDCERLAIGIFEGEQLVAVYKRHGRDKVTGATATGAFAHLLPRPDAYRFATDEDLRRARGAS